MKKLFLLVLMGTFVFMSTACVNTKESADAKESDVSSEIVLPTSDGTAQKVTFLADDGLEVTADYYGLPENKKLILACHQSRYSRGEYNEIAPILLKEGFNVLAIDQRSGGNINNKDNETAIRAQDQKLRTSPSKAYADVEAGLTYATTTLGSQKTVVMGSSYSSALAIVLGANHPDSVSAVLSFSPGNYVNVNDKTVPEYVKALKVPLYITSPKSEMEQWEEYVSLIDASLLTVYVDDVETKHGASCLWPTSDGSERHVEQMVQFLRKLK